MTTLFLHPVGLDRHVWDGIAAPGDLTLDFPGFGGTPPLPESLPGPLSLPALADHVAAALPGPVDVVGLSLGSMVSQHLALRHPELVRSLVLCAGGPHSNPDAARQRAQQARTGGMAGALPSTLTRWFTTEALHALHHPGVVYVRDRLLADDAETFARYWEAMGPHRVTESLGGIAVPVTVVAAAGDRSVPVATMALLADGITGAELRVVDGPHLLPLERPAEFRAILADHAARLP